MPVQRAALATLGCRLNQSETAVIEERLRRAGYDIVPFTGRADLGVVNTCTVTGEADAKSRKLIRSFLRRNPKAFLAVIGCYSEVDAEAVAAIEGVDLVLGTARKLDLLDYVAGSKNARPRIVRERIPAEDFAISGAPGNPALVTRANLKIQEGCDCRCAYCIVPFARGPARSRHIEDILDEARRLADRGVKEVVLTGVNIGAYSHEGLRLIDVIDRLHALGNLPRLRLSSTEPNALTEELFPRMRDPAHPLLPWLHVPVQSGSDTVLARMKRPYRMGRIRAFLEAARRDVPGICIGTDIMAGFPGETDEEFEETCAFVADGPVDYAHVFKFSPRAGTEAAGMPGGIDPVTLNARGARARRIAGRKRRRFQESLVGQTLEVLFEEEQEGLWTGYTGNYARVGCPSAANLANTIRRVTITDRSRGLLIGALT